MIRTDLQGNVAFVFDDYFDIDMICGTKYATEIDPAVLLPIAMSEIDPNFIYRVAPGDLLVGGCEFAYGHPHAQGMIVMRELGIATIIARSFARGFFKNEISNGMILLPCSELPDDIQQHERLAISLNRWTITRLKTGQVIPIDAISDIEHDIIMCGGLANYFKSNISDSLT